MTAPSVPSREDVAAVLAAALHEQMDGDYLVGAGRGVDNAGGDVGLNEVRPVEVVWWAAEACADAVLALYALVVEQAGKDRAHCNLISVIADAMSAEPGCRALLRAGDVAADLRAALDGDA